LLGTDTIALFTNQLRENIGVRYGNKEVTPGGKALKFYASVRIDVRKSSDEDAYKLEQHQTKVRIAKNKLAPPFGVGGFRIDPKTGIIPAYSMVEPAVELEIIKHEKGKGAKPFEYNGQIWKSENMLIRSIVKDKDLSNELINAIYTKLDERAMNAPVADVSVPDEDIDILEEPLPDEESPSETDED
jgi:recombination protein RecA